MKINRNSIAYRIIIIIVAICFYLLSINRLDAQGLYYDEVHQAVPAFNYSGQEQHNFSALSIRGIPVLNMTYSGAIKSLIYGLFLRYSKVGFSVTNWRLVGILCVSAALLLFGLILHKKLSITSYLIFGIFFVTDATVILTTRHDWGPVALALSLRLLIIAIWLRGELSEKINVLNSFVLGILVGISIFEKLSSIVLLPTIAIMFMFSPQRRKMFHLLSASIGLIVGLIPLIVSNIYSLKYSGYFVSTSYINSEQVFSITEIITTLKAYISLGAGELVEIFILGKNTPILSIAEFWALLLMVLLTVFITIKYHKQNINIRLAGILMLCYLVTLPSLYLLPQDTWVHHWIIGTPFQYLSISLIGSQYQKLRRVMVYIFSALLLIFIVIRSTGIFSLEQFLSNGDSSIKWDPSINVLGEFAQRNTDDSIFIAGDWGIANQLICFTNGKTGVIYELFYGGGNNRSVEDIVETIKNSNLPNVYLLFISPPVFTNEDRRDKILLEISVKLSPAWKLQPLEKDIANLNSVILYKYSK